jgi:hypothetical protein
MAAAWGFVDGLGVAAVPGVIAASVLVGLVWNYPVHRFYVFREAGERPAAKSRQPLDTS